MAKDRKKVLHMHSSVSDKQPTASSLEVGEIAVNNFKDQEFLSIKNTDDKVVRFSSDGQLVNIIERKEVMPYSGTVDNVHLDTNRSNIEIKLNQVVAANTVMHDKVNGAKDIDDDLVNPTIDGGLTNGAGFAIDMSRYAMIGANPSFSSVTVTHQSNLSGTTNISNGDGGSILNITTTSVSATNTNWNEQITNKDSKITTASISGNTLEITENNSITAKANGNACISAGGDLNIGGDSSTKIGYDCDGNGIANNTSIYASTAVTIDSPVTNITGKTNISGDTVIGGVLDTQKGLTKELSWNYGDVSNASSGKTNFSASTSFTIPNSVTHLSEWNNGCLEVNGCIRATSVYATSDERLKENIESADFSKSFDAHDIDIKSFVFSNDELKRKTYGVIAQDLLKHNLDELVYTDENGMHSVDYTSLMLLKIKFLENEIEFLKYRLDKLENKDE